MRLTLQVTFQLVSVCLCPPVPFASFFVRLSDGRPALSCCVSVSFICCFYCRPVRLSYVVCLSPICTFFCHVCLVVHADYITCVSATDFRLTARVTALPVGLVLSVILHVPATRGVSSALIPASTAVKESAIQ